MTAPPKDAHRQAIPSIEAKRPYDSSVKATACIVPIALAALQPVQVAMANDSATSKNGAPTPDAAGCETVFAVRLPRHAAAAGQPTP